MAFEAFTRKDSGGALHQRRAISYAAAACVLVGLGVASAALKSKELPAPAPPKEPDPVEVQLEEKIEEEKPPEPSPEPPPVEVPKHVKVSAAPPPPPPPDPDPNLKAKLDEKDPSKDVGAAGAHGGSGAGKPGGSGTKADAPVCGGDGQACCPGAICTGALSCEANTCRKPAPPPMPKVEIKKPALVSEDDVPAKALSTPPPSYPAAARAAGITGKVVVRLTIDEQGHVKDAKIAKGDPNFDAAVLAAVKSWKYEPAKHQDGKPFLSIKTVAIPFKIKL